MNPKLTPVPNGFNLTSLVREVAETTTLTGPVPVAAEVLSRIPEEHAPAALRQALTEFVRATLVHARPSGSPLESPAPAAAPVADPAAPVVGPVAVPRPSRKVAGVREAWRAWLDAQYRVRDGWTRLGDCTAEDLVFISGGLEEQARKHRSRAEGFRSLASALEVHGVERVRELPASVLASVGSVAA